MTDALISLAASLAVLGLALGLEAGPSRRIDPGSRERAARPVGPGGAAARLASYAARSYPSVPLHHSAALWSAGAGAGALAGITAFGFPFGMPAALAGILVADRTLVRLEERRQARLEGQLPDALLLQASALRAGRSMPSSLRVLAAEVPPPLGQEMAAAVGALDLGETPDRALEQLAHRARSRDVRLWVAAMLVHRRAGGNLAVVLDSLGERIRERINLRAEVRALTAQGRLSGLVIGAAPLAFFAVLSVTSRDQVAAAYATPLGAWLVATGLVLELLGFLWIRRILRVRS